jgi:methylated-DNA-[protein]-cysteine S-methyltransferase
MYYDHVTTPLGDLALVGDGSALTQLHLPGSKDAFAPLPGWKRDAAPFREARRQLDAYFAGELRDFDLPLAAKGTSFQHAVWDALCAIPYGETVSYAQIAKRIGKPAAMRAVGAANGANPIAIIVPCHRVIGADGSMTGYGGALPAKRLLLDLERRHRPAGTFALAG